MHQFSTSAVQRFKCLSGEYTLYVIANAHKDLGTLNLAAIKSLRAENASAYADLPMSAVVKVSIPAPAKGGSVLTLPPVVVTRCLAKIAYNISAAAGITIQSVQVMNVPVRMSLFSDTAPSANADDYSSGQVQAVTSTAPSGFSGVLYIPENAQGTVSTITSQSERTPTRAPKFAYYLLIRATCGTRVLAYVVYLGENTTTDFNVRRNTCLTLNITLRSDGQTDTRVMGYALSVAGDFSDDAIGDYCVTGDARGLYVEVEGNTAGMKLYGTLSLVEGDASAMRFEGAAGRSHTFEITNPSGMNSYALSYQPSLITSANSTLSYNVTIRDQYGYEQSYPFRHSFANEVTATTVGTGQGTVAATKALACMPQSSSSQLRAAALSEGWTLTATPDDMSTFGGWYSDKELTRQIATAQSFTFKPTTASCDIYARFDRIKRDVMIYTDIYKTNIESDAGVYIDQQTDTYIVPFGSRCTITIQDDVPLFDGWYSDAQCADQSFISSAKTLSFTAKDNRTIMPGFIPALRLDAAGTANCYILRTACGGRFSCAVMGNGKATATITPKALSGTSARVIWESGTTRGGVVADVQRRDDNTICLRTGTKEGNAVVGLFDTAGNVLWSWHIWVTGYEPATASHTYAGGHVFMNRNLGALNVVQTDPTARGLYYQWGRKDPFIQPATNSSAQRAAVVYGEGFAWGVASAAGRTLQWATAHPTAYIPCGDNANMDWLDDSNHNLWGNASVGSSYSGASAKSMYDPCPQGWRVPTPEAFSQAGFTHTATGAPNSISLQTSSVNISFPLGGYMKNGTYSQNGTSAYLWSNSPANSGIYFVYPDAIAFSASATAVSPKTSMNRDTAMPVRCMKE